MILHFPAEHCQTASGSRPTEQALTHQGRVWGFYTLDSFRRPLSRSSRARVERATPRGRYEASTLSRHARSLAEPDQRPSGPVTEKQVAALQLARTPCPTLQFQHKVCWRPPRHRTLTFSLALSSVCEGPFMCVRPSCARSCSCLCGRWLAVHSHCLHYR